MINTRPVTLIIIGFVLVLLGAGLPFLMVMRILKSTFFLNFFSYTASVVGLFLGLIGAALYVRLHRKKDKDLFPPQDFPPDDRKDW